MWVIKDIRRSAAILVALTGPVSALSVEYDWLDAMMQAVLVEQANEGPLWGSVCALCRSTGDGARASR